MTMKSRTNRIQLTAAVDSSLIGTTNQTHPKNTPPLSSQLLNPASWVNTLSPFFDTHFHTQQPPPSNALPSTLAAARPIPTNPTTALHMSQQLATNTTTTT